MTRGITRVVRSPSKGEHRVKLYVRQIFIKSSDGLPALHRSTDVFREEPRSTRDRGLIVADRYVGGISGGSSMIEARSPSNPSPIAIQLRPDRHTIVA